ncbi:hypothetical protein CHU98_g4083 [Xylaria longipes]|nr:hypothetical protein CHU98_g4083 [Xylaria longipes]
MPYRAMDIEYQLFTDAEMQGFPSANETPLGKRRRFGRIVDSDDDHRYNSLSQGPATKMRKVSSRGEDELVLKYGLGIAELTSEEQCSHGYEKPCTSTKTMNEGSVMIEADISKITAENQPSGAMASVESNAHANPILSVQKKNRFTSVNCPDEIMLNGVTQATSETLQMFPLLKPPGDEFSLTKSWVRSSGRVMAVHLTS